MGIADCFLLTFTKSCALVSLAIPGTSGLLLGNIRFQPRTFPVVVVPAPASAIVAAGHSLIASPIYAG